MNGYKQGFRFVASFGFGGQKSASNPPQAICKPLYAIKMKYIIPILTSILCFHTDNLFAQRISIDKNVHIDTIQLISIKHSCIDSIIYGTTVPLSEGYNVLVDSNGTILSEGQSKKNKRIGFWRFYESGLLQSIVYFDQYGNMSKRILVNEKGQIRTEK